MAFQSNPLSLLVAAGLATGLADDADGLADDADGLAEVGLAAAAFLAAASLCDSAILASRSA